MSQPEVSVLTSDPTVKDKKQQVFVEKTEKDEDKIEKDKEEENEKQDTEKPLLQDEDTVTIELENGGDASNTPTLPLPHKKSPTQSDQDDDKNPDAPSEQKKEPPSMFIQPFERMRYEWQNCSNTLEFLVKAVCIIFASLGWVFCVGGIPLMSIVMLIIGSVYLHDCPAEPRIPEYLIVAGFFGTLQHIVAVWTKYAPKSKWAEGFNDLLQAQRRRCLCIECLLQIFLVIWFISGCAWVYSIYEPEYKMKEYDNYCHKTVYLFTFWMFNISFIILLCIVVVGICCIIFAVSAPKPERTSIQEP